MRKEVAQATNTEQSDSGGGYDCTGDWEPLCGFLLSARPRPWHGPDLSMPLWQLCPEHSVCPTLLWADVGGGRGSVGGREKPFSAI